MEDDSPRRYAHLFSMPAGELAAKLQQLDEVIDQINEIRDEGYDRLRQMRRGLVVVAGGLYRPMQDNAPGDPPWSA